MSNQITQKLMGHATSATAIWYDRRLEATGRMMEGAPWFSI
jgi:hypothetical protein